MRAFDAVARRQALGVALGVLSVAIPSPRHALASTTAPVATDGLPGWAPLDKERTARRALSAVEAQYPPQFVAYLARFLARFDQLERASWEQRQKEAATFVPSVQDDSLFARLNEGRSEAYLRASFGSVITSVEVGLEAFPGTDGVARLASQLSSRYSGAGLEAKRALAQLFTLIDDPEA